MESNNPNQSPRSERDSSSEKWSGGTTLGEGGPRMTHTSCWNQCYHPSASGGEKPVTLHRQIPCSLSKCDASARVKLQAQNRPPTAATKTVRSSLEFFRDLCKSCRRDPRCSRDLGLAPQASGWELRAAATVKIRGCAALKSAATPLLPFPPGTTVSCSAC